MIKNMHELAIEISKREGKKVNLPIAQIQEVLAHLSDVMCEDDRSAQRPGIMSIGSMILFNGHRRSKVKKP